MKPVEMLILILESDLIHGLKAFHHLQQSILFAYFFNGSSRSTRSCCLKPVRTDSVAIGYEELVEFLLCVIQHRFDIINLSTFKMCFGLCFAINLIGNLLLLVDYAYQKLLHFYSLSAHRIYLTLSLNPYLVNLDCKHCLLFLE